MGERRPWQQIRYLDPDPEYLHFASQVHYRQGYDIWARYGSCLQGGLMYARRGRSHKGWVIAPRFAVEEHNRVKGRNLKLIETLRVNLQGGSSRWYYITLLAKDEGENVSTYQAKVTDNLRKKTMSLAYFGLAPYATSVLVSDQNVTPLVASNSLATEGFDLGTCYGAKACGSLVEVTRDSYTGFVDAPRFAVEQYNRTKGAKFVFVSTLKVNLQDACGRRKYYITLLAKDEHGKENKLQAKVWYDKHREPSLLLLQRAPDAASGSISVLHLSTPVIGQKRRFHGKRPRSDWEEDAEFLHYASQVQESSGFDIGSQFGWSIQGGIVEVTPYNSHTGFVDAPRFAVEQYNYDTGGKLKFVETLKVNQSCPPAEEEVKTVRGELITNHHAVYYITLLVKDPSGKLYQCQAEVVYMRWEPALSVFRFTSGADSCFASVVNGVDTSQKAIGVNDGQSIRKGDSDSTDSFIFNAQRAVINGVDPSRKANGVHDGRIYPETGLQSTDPSIFNAQRAVVNGVDPSQKAIGVNDGQSIRKGDSDSTDSFIFNAQRAVINGVDPSRKANGVHDGRIYPETGLQSTDPSIFNAQRAGKEATIF